MAGSCRELAELLVYPLRKIDQPGSAAFDASSHLRSGDPHRGGEDWRRDAADHPGLDDALRAILRLPRKSVLLGDRDA
jgi:hypothetical protein